MTFIQGLSRWFQLIFKVVSDVIVRIFGTYWFAFWIVALLVFYWLMVIADMIPSPIEIVRTVRRTVHEDERYQRRQERAIKEQQRQQVKAAENRKADFAQWYLGTTGNKSLSYITIEGKRYYRKGLVERGSRIKPKSTQYEDDN